MADDVVVPPGQVCGGGEEPDDQNAALLLETGLAGPSVDFPAIGRVHKDTMAGPVLLETVFGFREIGRALGRFGRRAWVKREVELRMEWFEDLGRRSPVTAVPVIPAVVLGADST